LQEFQLLRVMKCPLFNFSLLHEKCFIANFFKQILQNCPSFIIKNGIIHNTFDIYKFDVCTYVRSTMYRILTNRIPRWWLEHLCGSFKEQDVLLLRFINLRCISIAVYKCLYTGAFLYGRYSFLLISNSFVI
jgi:hypothetical protein